MNDARIASPNAAAATVSPLRRRVALATAAAGIVATIAVCAWAFGNVWQPARLLAQARGTGWVALAALLLSLLITPLGRIGARLGVTPRAPLPALTRRALGMAAAWLALGHAACSFAGALDANWSALWSWPHLRSGVLALALLLVLLATSFTRVVALLRLRFWRELHRVAYVVPLLVLQHALLSPFAPRALVLALVASVYGLGLARLLPARPARSGAPDAKRDEAV